MTGRSRSKSMTTNSKTISPCKTLERYHQVCKMRAMSCEGGKGCTLSYQVYRVQCDYQRYVFSYQELYQRCTLDYQQYKSDQRRAFGYSGITLVTRSTHLSVVGPPVIASAASLVTSDIPLITGYATPSYQWYTQNYQRCIYGYHWCTTEHQRLIFDCQRYEFNFQRCTSDYQSHTSNYQ